MADLAKDAKVSQAYEARLSHSETRLDILRRIVDYPSTMPPKNYLTSLLTTPERAIPDSAQQSFNLFSDPQMPSSQWKYFFQRLHPYLQKPFSCAAERARWVEGVLGGHDRLSRISWERCSVERLTSEAEGISGYGRFTTILGEMGMGLLLFDVHRSGLPLKTPFKQRDLKLSSPSVILTSIDHVKGGTTLQANESPYLVRILTVANLIYADQIQDLAARRGCVSVEAGKAVWPKFQGTGTRDITDDYKVRKAQELINWVFNSAFEGNIEFVILTDGWRSITFFVHENRNLVVGPTMLPRINRPACDPSLSDGSSLGQAYIATVFLAWSRKKKNTQGTKLFLDQWDGVEAPVDQQDKPKKKRKRGTANSGARKKLASRQASSNQVQASLPGIAHPV